jgi:hypothetical protein
MPARQFSQRARRLLSQDRRPRAVRLLANAAPAWKRRPEAWQWIAESAPPETVIPVALQLSRQGYYSFAAGILTCTSLQATTYPQRRGVARALIHGGQHAVAISYLEEPAAVEPAPDVDVDDELRKETHQLELAQFYLAANDYLGQLTAPQTDEIQGFVVVFNAQNHVLSGLMVPMAGLLMDKGYPLKAVTPGTLTTPPAGIAAFDSLEGCIAPGGLNFVRHSDDDLAHDWTVDWPAGVVEAGGINYYSYFQERLAQQARAYRTGISDDPESAAKFDLLLRRADVALSLCERVLDLAGEQSKPVRIALQDSHFAPAGVIREWCHQVGSHHGIHAVVLSVGYENYYSNLTSLHATTLAVEDLTANPTVRQPFLGGPHRLDAALAEDPGLDKEPDDQVLSWIVQDRSRVELSSPGRDEALARVERARAAGGKVFVALGKVTIDFAAPGDRGFAHADFVEWINHLVEAVTDTDNLLLIKPHPHELREEIVNDGVQPLRELVVPDLPENVRFLDHNSFNTHELAELVDAALLWNGTAILEFSVLGVPVLPASVWADRDYPVGFEILRTRDEYEQVLRGVRELSVAPDATRRSAAMLRLMRSDHVAIPYGYVSRSAINLDMRAPRLDVEMLSKLAEQPDRYVERAALRFFEFA